MTREDTMVVSTEGEQDTVTMKTAVTGEKDTAQGKEVVNSHQEAEKGEDEGSDNNKMKNLLKWWKCSVSTTRSFDDTMKSWLMFGEALKSWYTSAMQEHKKICARPLSRGRMPDRTVAPLTPRADRRQQSPRRLPITSRMARPMRSAKPWRRLDLIQRHFRTSDSSLGSPLIEHLKEPGQWLRNLHKTVQRTGRWLTTASTLRTATQTTN
jgi:hypothetical protein